VAVKKGTDEKAFLKRVRKTLDQSEERIESATRSRLFQIRVDALEHSPAGAAAKAAQRGAPLEDHDA